MVMETNVSFYVTGNDFSKRLATIRIYKRAGLQRGKLSCLQKYTVRTV
jgi:hypothetical protein